MARDVQDPPRPRPDLRDEEDSSAWTDTLRAWNERYGTYVSFAIVAGLFVTVLLFALGKWREATIRQANRDLYDKTSVEEVRKVLERYRGTDAEVQVLLTLADVAMKEGDTTVARTSFDRVLEIAGDSPLAQTARRGLEAVKDEEAWRADSPAIFEKMKSEGDDLRKKFYPPPPPELPAGPLPPGVEPPRESEKPPPSEPGR